MPRLDLEDERPPGSAGEARARQSAVRDRLRGALASTASGKEVPSPVEDASLPCDPGMIESAIAEIVALLAVQLKITAPAILTDIRSPLAIEARRMAAALAMLWLKLPRARAANHFGILEGSVTDGLKRINPILLRYAIPAQAPRADAIGLIVRELSAAGELSSLITIPEIQGAICEAFGVTPHELISETRLRMALIPRQFAMALSQRLTHRSLHNIGRAFGGRHHTSVLYAIKKVKSTMAQAEAALPPCADLAEWVKAVKDVFDAQKQKSKSNNPNPRRKVKSQN
jgi:Bacterial dnaA protein helix-turn-helix